MHELTKEMTPENRHQIAQIVGFTVERLQEPVLEPYNSIADIKNIAYGDKAQFKFKDKDTIRAYKQAKGSTTARSYAAPEQTFTMDTHEISARPAIHMGDLRTGRVNMTDLIKEANEEFTRAKQSDIETCLQAAIATKSSPYYASGLTKANLDAMITYFRNAYGPVTLLGGYDTLSKLPAFAGWSQLGGNGTAASPAYWNNGIEQWMQSGFATGMYNGCPLVVLPNAYKNDSADMRYNWDATNDREKFLYVVPGGLTPDKKNLKIVNEGGIMTMESQNIDDLTFEIRLDTWYGVAFFDRLGKVNSGDASNSRRITIGGILRTA